MVILLNKNNTIIVLKNNDMKEDGCLKFSHIPLRKHSQQQRLQKVTNKYFYNTFFFFYSQKDK